MCPRHRRWLPALPVAVAIALAPVAGSACGDDGEEPADVEGSPELREGAEIYGARCASCHGRDGDGGSGPALSDGRSWSATPTSLTTSSCETGDAACPPGKTP
jgi:mono/diheme cytochrome c family protein